MEGIRMSSLQDFALEESHETKKAVDWMILVVCLFTTIYLLFKLISSIRNNDWTIALISLAGCIVIAYLFSIFT
jgi:hypothetical protein